MSKKTLIYDSGISGHHTEYLEHLARYLKESDNLQEYYFLVNPKFTEKFAYITEITKNANNVHWIFLQQKEYEKINSGQQFVQSFKIYFLLKRYAGKLNISQIIIMHFNTLQLAFCFFRPQFKVFGILFLQFFRQSKNTLKEKIRYYRKYFITKMFAHNSSLENIFILNDEKAAQYFNREFKTNIFRILSDPVPDLKPLENFDVYKEYGIDHRRKIHLHIGALSERKGTLEILNSILFLDKKEQEQICFFFAGKSIDDIFKKKLSEQIDYYRESSSVQIVWIDEFISKELMKTLFDQCFCALLPYKMPEASSGIYGHAVAAGKRIIGNSQGLLGELVENYELGITIDKINSEQIAEGIKKSYKIINKEQTIRQMNNTPFVFAQSLLNGK
jgi:glycosyltransferase involved in cell wall biosynthesis